MGMAGVWKRAGGAEWPEDPAAGRPDAVIASLSDLLDLLDGSEG
jgi:FMN phosphatase YigB (HAD superfamily)